MQEEKGFSKFGMKFQRKLAELILRDRAFSERINEVLELEYFEKKYLKVFVDKVNSYRNKYDVHPSIDTMQTIVRSELGSEYSDTLKRKVREFFAHVKSRGQNATLEDADYVKEKALDFCKRQELRSALLKAHDKIEEENYEEVNKIIKEAQKKGAERDIGHEYVVDFESRYDERQRPTVTTGWDRIDNVMQGGHGKGELGVCIGVTGGGKSMTLTHLGAHPLMSGKNVVHYTLELADDVVGNRYDSCITQESLNDLHEHKDEIEQQVKDVEGNLIIKQYPTKGATTQTLDNHLGRVQNQKMEVDVVIVDYGDLLRPVSGREFKRDELQSIYENLRALAKNHDVAVYTASQSNRDGMNEEIITMEEISEAFNKCFVADFIFSISQTIEDQARGTGRLFVAKNRNGPDGDIYPVSIDFERVHINVLEGETLNSLEKERKKQKKDIFETFQSEIKN